MSEILNLLKRPREATIQANDVFGHLPAGRVTDHLPDFDAALTAQVRNTHHFNDYQFGIGSWPALGDYSAVLIDQLVGERAQLAATLGLDNRPSKNTKLHPDLQELYRNLDQAVILIVNSAPRRADHHQTGKNGDDFYLAITVNGVEVYSQIQYLRGLVNRGLVQALYHIPNDAGVWADGEQFRSSIVTQIRHQPKLLQTVPINILPDLELDGRLAYADKFGDVRLELASVNQATKDWSVGQTIRLNVDGKLLDEDILVVERLTDIPEGRLGAYRNPVDSWGSDSPGYVELIRRVSNCNDTDPRLNHHAYSTLVELANIVRPDDWENINLKFV